MSQGDLRDIDDGFVIKYRTYSNDASLPLVGLATHTLSPIASPLPLRGSITM